MGTNALIGFSPDLDVSFSANNVLEIEKTLTGKGLPPNFAPNK